MGETHVRVQQDVSDPVPIRHAATIILVRNPTEDPAILMGQRGKSAVFMPDKFVFPGGAVDDADADTNATLDPVCTNRLQQHSDCAPETLAAAALRELHEETGHHLDVSKTDTLPLRFFFRAITPPGRPRRFDARFFLADAARLATDPDVFNPAEAELSHLQWVPLPKVRDLNLPFITRVVLAELAQHLPSTDAPDRVPFVRNDDVERDVVWL